MLPLLPALVLGIVGLFRDERKWLAGVAVGLSLLPVVALFWTYACLAAFD